MQKTAVKFHLKALERFY